MEIKRRGFTLTEIVVVVAILGLFILIVFELLSSVRKSATITDWRARTNTQLSETHKLLNHFLSNANYPALITENAAYQNPQPVGGGLYKQAVPEKVNRFRYFADSDEIKLGAKDEINLMAWSVNTPEVIIVGKEQNPETALCFVRLKKSFEGRSNVMTFEIQGPPQYDRFYYANNKWVINNQEKVLLDNVDYVSISLQEKYSDDQIERFNQIKSNPGASLLDLPAGDPRRSEIFHEWMNPHTLTVEIGIKENHQIKGLLRRKTEFSVNGKFTVDPLSVMTEKDSNI